MEETVHISNVERLCIMGRSYVRKLFRTIFVIINNIYCIPTYVIWMLIFLPVKKFNSAFYTSLEGTFYHWLISSVALWAWWAGYTTVELGDNLDICVEDRALVIANHQSTADVPLLMAMFNTKKGALPNIMWIMDRVFKFTNFGICSVLHEDFFIVSGKEKREESLRTLVRHLHNSFIPKRRKWIVLFPEGGFLKKRREVSQRYAQKCNLPVLNNVSLPRTGAMRVIMEQVGYPLEILEKLNTPDKSEHSKDITANHLANIANSEEPAVKESKEELLGGKDQSNSDKLRWIIDITIAYPKGEPLDLPTIVTGSRPPCQTLLICRRYPLNEIPVAEEAMKEWLYDRFIEKEKMLTNFYNTGELPSEKNFRWWTAPKETKQNAFQFLAVHVFFITSTCFHYVLFSSIFSYLREHLSWFSL